MNKVLFLLSLCLPLSGFAGPIDSPAAAIKVKNELQNEVLAMDGVVGIGVTGCDVVTGNISDFSGDFVHCVSIMTESDVATEQVLVKFPAGSKYDGVFIAVETTGPIEIEPRGSVGN